MVELSLNYLQPIRWLNARCAVALATAFIATRQLATLNNLPGSGPAPIIESSEQKPLSAQRAAWLILRGTETLTTEEQETLKILCQHPELSAPVSLAQGFLKLVRQLLPQQLDSWLELATDSFIQTFQSFANGLREDYDAVKAGVTLEVSNGQVEGQNNRLKMLKRQMFGRAGLDLLAKWFILAG